jgi:hypothetical protein
MEGIQDFLIKPNHNPSIRCVKFWGKYLGLSSFQGSPSAMNLVFITYEEKGNTKAHQDKCN